MTISTGDDSAFDEVLPGNFRGLSETHWSPVAIARRAAQWLAPDERARVLDVGAGVGKFCIVGALTTPGTFVGCERRPHLADVARRIVEEQRIRRVEILACDVREVDWSGFTGFYLFNPFADYMSYPGDPPEESVSFAETSCLEVIRWVEGRLRELAPGTRVVTHHGFGGEMPRGYRLAIEEACNGDYLRLWVRE